MNWKTKGWLVRWGPTMLFVLTLGSAFWLHGPFDGPGTVLGFAEGEEVAVSSMQASRVLAIRVQPGQKVEAGEVIVDLDPAPLDADIAIAEAEIQQLNAEIAAGRMGAERTLQKDTDTRQIAVEEIALSLERERATQEGARAELNALRKERRRLKDLLNAKLATSDDLVSIDVRYRTLQREAQERPRTIKLLEEQLATARGRANSGQASGVDVVVQPVKQQRRVVQKRLDRLKAQREGLGLRSPTEGRVVAVHHRPGEVVAGGQPIVSVVSHMSGRVVACLSEENALTVSENDRALLRVRGASGEEMGGRVAALGPLVDEVPVRCRTNPVQPSWGRNVVILLDNPADVVPGQAFVVRFQPGGEVSATGEALAAPVVSPGEPQAMRIPGSLKKASRFEPSGLVWSASLRRYLVVSDDTGHKGISARSPWIFTMDEHGAVDGAPLPVAKAGTFNDLEGIAPGSAGTYYLLSSQSHSKKGNRPADRTAFVRIREGADGFTMDARVLLADALQNAGDSKLAELGIAEGITTLDIEGLASRDGALYLGLKSPLGSDGRALIWRMGKPDVLLDGGDLKGAELELWGRIALKSGADGREVPAGVSELLFHPEGPLGVAATPTSGDPDHVTGRLYIVARPEKGVLEARVWREFPGRKPEGLSHSATQGRVTVAFDAGAENPDWVELVWP